MVRTAKPAEVAAKRNAILDSAQRLVFTKGYAEMSLQDVLADLQISGGAFHHYFDSRGALLTALIERIEQDSTTPLLPIVDDPHLTAVQKLQAFLHALDQLRIERKQDVLTALRVWYTDGNALVRQRVDEAIRARRAPLLARIVQQGLREGIFTTPFPAQAGDVLMALLQSMGDAHARLLLLSAETMHTQDRLTAVITTHAAYMDAVERVLGAPANCLQRADAQAVVPWLTALEQA